MKKLSHSGIFSRRHIPLYVLCLFFYFGAPVPILAHLGASFGAPVPFFMILCIILFQKHENVIKMSSRSLPRAIFVIKDNS